MVSLLHWGMFDCGLRLTSVSIPTVMYDPRNGIGAINDPGNNHFGVGAANPYPWRPIYS